MWDYVKEWGCTCLRTRDKEMRLKHTSMCFCPAALFLHVPPAVHVHTRSPEEQFFKILQENYVSFRNKQVFFALFFVLLSLDLMVPTLYFQHVNLK